MQTLVELITPERAKELVANKHDNRPLAPTFIAQYEADMRAGKWGMNGATIVISNAGRLLDGQNRMEAVIRSGCSVLMLVVYGVDEGQFVTMDSGKSRSISDVLATLGWANSTMVGAIGRLAYSFLQGTGLHVAPPSKMARLAFADQHPQVAVIAAATKRCGPAVSPGSAFGAVMLLAAESGKMAGKAEAFMESMADGIYLEKGDPVHTLRAWVAHQPKSRMHSAITSEAMFSATIRAWNAYARGETLNRIHGLQPPYRDTHSIVGLDLHCFKEVPVIQQRREVKDDPVHVAARRVNDSTVAHVLQLTDQGLKPEQIAAEVGLGKKTVQLMQVGVTAQRLRAQQRTAGAYGRGLEDRGMGENGSGLSA